jgi:hypothetical protein
MSPALEKATESLNHSCARFQVRARPTAEPFQGLLRSLGVVIFCGES